MLFIANKAVENSIKYKFIDRHEAVENCRRAMKLAHREFNVPMVLEPEYLASPWLDELSGMTYLSYFMKPGSTGAKATLDWVNSRLDRPINNFTVSSKFLFILVILCLCMLVQRYKLQVITIKNNVIF